MKENYNFVDVLKFIFAFAVIVIHAQSFCGEDFAPTVEYVIRIAVPFYFIFSGFFLQVKIESNPLKKSQVVLKQLKRIVSLFLIWVIIYLPLDCAAYVVDYQSRFTVAEYVLYLLQHIIISGETAYSWPLWYLYSLAIAILFVLCFNRVRFYTYYLFACGVVLWLLNVYIVRDETSFVSHAFKSCFRWYEGLPYVMIGMIVAQYRNRIGLDDNKSVLVPIVALLLVVSLIMFRYDLPFTYLLGGLSVSLLCLLFEYKTKYLTFKNIRMGGEIIYFTHMYVLVLLDWLGWKEHGLCWFCLESSAASLLISIMYLKISAIPSFSFLKKLT